MKRTPISRGIASTLLTVWLSFAASTVHAAEDTIKVGILHSLSGTMAISESVLKDTVLMLIADQNKKGGLLGKKLEPVVVDPASDWDAFAEKARELLVKEKVAVVFGCWTSLSRKAVLPIFEQLNGLLYYPVQYEGEESSRNIFYTRRRAEPAGDSGRPVPDEQGGRRRSPVGSARDRLSLSAQDQPDPERISRGGGRAPRRTSRRSMRRRTNPTGARSSRR